MRIGILEPKNFSSQALIALQKIGLVTIYEGNNIGEFLSSLEALFVRLAFKIDKDLLRQCPQLRWLCSPTTGHSHLDEIELTKRGIQILSLRGEREFLETIRATPEHALGLIIALLRKYRRAFDDCGDGKWDRDVCRGEEIHGNSIGIIGLGRVGYRLATYLHGMGARVNWYDPKDVLHHSEWIRTPSVKTVIAESKVIVLCASHHAGQPPVLGREEIHWLKGRYFVNIARGELVDEEALLTAVSSGCLAGVAIDVLDCENKKHRLKDWRTLMAGRNLILTPHIGGATISAMAQTECRIADKLAEASTIYRSTSQM